MRYRGTQGRQPCEEKTAVGGALPQTKEGQEPPETGRTKKDFLP